MLTRIAKRDLPNEKRDYYNGTVVVSFRFFINGNSLCVLGKKSSCVGFVYGKRDIINENMNGIF